MKSYLTRVLSHGFLCFFVILMLLPVYLAFVAASNDGNIMMQSHSTLLPGTLLFENLKAVMTQGLPVINGVPLTSMLLNSLLMALAIAFGKVVFALGSAFSLVYFDFPFKKTCFALIFVTMMLPIEVRIIPTFQVVASLGLLNSFTGLTVPLFVSATGTFLFRQFFKTLSPELVDAAKLDGAGAVRFFFDMVLPLSKIQIVSLFVILFVYGWNQYLWPLIVTTETKMTTVVMGIRYLAFVADQIPQWQYIMVFALIALIPPCMVVMFLQHWFEKGLK